ncbi:MAG: hypothetical protein AAFP19_02830 [Bacteroidota bacterium]
MRRALLSVGVLLTLIFSLPAQDIYVPPFDELHFHSPYEKSTLSKGRFPNLSDQLSLFLASSNQNDSSTLVEVNQRVESLLQEISQKLNKKKSYKKQSKLLFNIVHNRLLKKYVEQATFEQIFETGVFNCVTATALYVMVFEHFDIPYAIKLEPNHVFPIIDPDGESIFVETTDPRYGVTTFSDKDKRAFVNYLRETKLISETEAKSQSVQELFSQYYLGDNETINIRQLAGAQYYNNALYALDVEDAQTALAMIEKATYLHATPRNQLVVFSSLYQLVTAIDYSNKDSFRPLFKLLLHLPSEEVNLEVEQQFGKLSEELLIERSSEKAFRDYYILFKEAVAADSSLSKTIDEIFHFQLSRFYVLSFRTREALEHAEKAYALNPQNVRIRKLLTEVFLEQLRHIKDTKRSYEELNDFTQRHPFLERNPILIDFRLFCLSQLASQYYDLEEEEKAEQYFELFNQRINNFEHSANVDQYIATCYSNKSSYLFREKKFKDARQWLEKGLVMLPNNEMLTRKLKALEEYEEEFLSKGIE